MKRFVFVVVVALMMITSVQAASLTFQQPEDFIAQMTCTHNPCYWSENTSGGNSYFSVIAPGRIINTVPSAMSYAAFTEIGSNQKNTGDFCNVNALADFIMYDQNLNNIGTFSTNPGAPNPVRWELYIQGGTATAYANGTFVQNITGLTVYPFYIEMQQGCIDDVVWGNTDPRYIFGMPDQGYYTGKKYFLMKDILNNAASGFYRVNTTSPNGSPVLMTSWNFTSTYGKNNGNNETVVLSSPTGGIVQSRYTGVKWADQLSWDLDSFFATAPYGLYSTEINPQNNSPGFKQSEYMPYIGSGATIEFDKSSYAIGETATVTVTITHSYYDAVSNPRVVIQDIFGTEVYNSTEIVFNTTPTLDYAGSIDYKWADTDVDGVYLGLIYSTVISTGQQVLMNYDTADVSSTLVVNGYVKNAETTNVISGAMVNVTQVSTVDSLTTAADGNYTTTSDFSANAPVTLFAHATGYEDYTHTFTPLYAGSLLINISLMPVSPTHSGIALGGIARTPPYNRTIDSATITIQNGTSTHIETTNSAGYYIRDYLVNNTLYDVWGSKASFTNSTVYQKLVIGS